MAYRYDPATGQKRHDPPSEPKPGQVSAEQARNAMMGRQRRETMRVLGEKPVAGVWNSGVEKPKPPPSRPINAADAYADFCRRLVENSR